MKEYVIKNKKINCHRHVSVISGVVWRVIFKLLERDEQSAGMCCSGDKCPFVVYSDGKCKAREKAGVVLPRCFGHHSFRSGQQYWQPYMARMYLCAWPPAQERVFICILFP